MVFSPLRESKNWIWDSKNQNNKCKISFKYSFSNLIKGEMEYLGRGWSKACIQMKSYMKSPPLWLFVQQLILFQLEEGQMMTNIHVLPRLYLPEYLQKVIALRNLSSSVQDVQGRIMDLHIKETDCIATLVTPKITWPLYSRCF